MTVRLAEEAVLMVLNSSIAETARRTGMSPSVIQRLIRPAVTMINDTYRPSPTWAIGIDEVHIRGRVQTTITDPVHNRLIDILRTQSRAAVEEALAALDGRPEIRLAIIDMHAPYRKALRTVLPDAVVVADRFHVVNLARKAMLAVRQAKASEVPRSLTQHRPGGRRRERLTVLLTKRWHTIAPRNQTFLHRLFHHHPLLGQAYWAKEDFAAIYDSGCRAEAEERFAAWTAALPKRLRPFASIPRTVGQWREEIFAYFDHTLPPLDGRGEPRRPTAALTESLNGRIKQIEREGRGNTGFDLLRAKALFRLGSLEEDGVRAIAREIVGG